MGHSRGQLKSWVGMCLLLVGLVLTPHAVFGQSRDQVRVTGSSSVFPFAAAVAEEFGRTSRYKAPIVEGIGTGGGFRLFCAGLGSSTPDIVNASRQIKPSEIRECEHNNVGRVIEIKFGYDGIVLANSKTVSQLQLSISDIFLALATTVPERGYDGGPLVPNPFQKWSDIRPTLPDRPIQILGPPPTSGTRDAFNETVLAVGCRAFPALLDLETNNPDRFFQVCQAIREDGVYIESGENDNLIVQKLITNRVAVGIFAFSFLDQNNDLLQPSLIAKTGMAYIEPTFEAIASGDYPIFRSLYFYVKEAHLRSIPGIGGYLREFTSDTAWGDFGYLTDRGLIPLSLDERSRYRKIVADLTSEAK